MKRCASSCQHSVSGAVAVESPSNNEADGITDAMCDATNVPLHECYRQLVLTYFALGNVAYLFERITINNDNFYSYAGNIGFFFLKKN